MKLHNTTATDFIDMLAQLHAWLLLNGWTGSLTPGNTLSQLINSNGLTFNTGYSTTARTDYFSGAFTDNAMKLTYDKSNIGAGTGASAPTTTNDMTGPFLNLWFITDDDATYCHVIAQPSASRYSHFSFGEVNNKGAHSVALPFCAGLYWIYWCTEANYSNTPGETSNPFNWPRASNHLIPYLNGNVNTKVGIPDGLLDTSLFFTSGPIVDTSLLYMSDRSPSPFGGSQFDDGYMFDYTTAITNKTYIGGVPVSPMPLISTAGTNSVRAYIGDVPGVAAVNMMGLSPGQKLTFGTEEWLVFPYKQGGNLINAKYGALPLPIPNSWVLGFAYKVKD